MSKIANNPTLEDFEDFFENALCGYLILDKNGFILRSNIRFANWIGLQPDDLAGTRFSDHLPMGGKIYYETHLAPLLRMQGHFEEIAVSLVSRDRGSIPVLVNAYERRDAGGVAEFVRLTVYKATDRRIYENNLRAARDAAEGVLNNERYTGELREQFIAVLGHDLRNPLGAIISAVTILESSSLPATELRVVGVIKRSAARINDLVSDVMDFARGRLGGGMSLNSTPTLLGPVLDHVIDEIRSIWPKRDIQTEIRVSNPVTCDAPRISQLLSNLLSNAITHGSQDTPVTVKASIVENAFELSVGNAGPPIPPKALDRLFQPFKREDERSSQNGLGLGLYIAAEIARAHKGILSVASDEAETRFTFKMPLSAQI